MSQFPYMPVFTDALLGDTTHLSAEEFGSYCLIMMATWNNHGRAFADDDNRMARICRITTKRWRLRIRPVLIGFFDLSDGVWNQKRLSNEFKKCSDYSASRSVNGAKGGRHKSLIHNETDKAHGFCMPKHTESIAKAPIPILISKKKDSPLPPTIEAPNQRDVCVFEEAWKLFPRRVGKGQARKAWGAALQKAGAATIIAGIRKYAVHCRAENTEERYIAHPATWLNGERWLDGERTAGVPIANGSNGHAETRQQRYGEDAYDATDQQWRNRVNEFAEAGRWQTRWGLPPDDPMSQAPRAIVEELGVMQR